MRSILSGAVFAALLVPAVAHAQASHDNAQSVDKRIAADRAAVKAAYATKDQKRIAAAKARLDKDYVADWGVNHPESVKDADARLARDQALTKAALESKDPRRIAEAKANERQADQADWTAHHQQPN